MFAYTYRFNQPINTEEITKEDGTTYIAWNVSNVTNMSGMFEWTPFNQPLNNWDVSNVTDMSGMFYHASFNQPLNNWNVSNVTNMNYMFCDASSFNQPLNNWDVSNVTNMENMFREANSFNQPINTEEITKEDGTTYIAWNVSNVTNMSGMFEKAESFNQHLNNWDVSNVTDMSGMFYYAHSFNQDITTWIINDNCKITTNIVIKHITDEINITTTEVCMFDNSGIKRENFENKNYCSKIALSFRPPLPNPKTNEELENIKIEKIKSNIRIFEENKNLPKLCDDVEIVIKDFLI